jgi:hypothetical protein
MGLGFDHAEQDGCTLALQWGPRISDRREESGGQFRQKEQTRYVSITKYSEAKRENGAHSMEYCMNTVTEIKYMCMERYSKTTM